MKKRGRGQSMIDLVVNKKPASYQQNKNKPDHMDSRTGFGKIVGTFSAFF